MKSKKKIYCSLLLLLSIILSFSVSANAAIPSTNPPIIPSTEFYASTHAYSEYGTFYINSGTLEVRNNLNYNSGAAATYGAGESFNYQYVVEVSDSNHYFQNRYASYVSLSGVRRYVYFMYIENYNTSPKRIKLANYTIW